MDQATEWNSGPGTLDGSAINAPPLHRHRASEGAPPVWNRQKMTATWNTPSTSKRALLRELRRVFALDWAGIHGAPHWARVRLNGLRLAPVNGARADVVEMFALIHDSRRVHDGRDEEHGSRAAQLAKEWNCSLLRLDAKGLELRRYACRYHSDGMTEADVTVQTCWDADRLDLGRVGTHPNPRRLCTDGARDRVFLDAAYQRSLGVPVWARKVR